MAAYTTSFTANVNTHYLGQTVVHTALDRYYWNGLYGPDAQGHLYGRGQRNHGQQNIVDDYIGPILYILCSVTYELL